MSNATKEIKTWGNCIGSVLCICLFLLMSVGHTHPIEKPLVLIINSYHPSYRWTGLHNDSMRRVLHPWANVKVLNMDTKRQPPERFEEIADKTYAEAISLNADLIILCDDNAVKFLGNRLAKSNKVIYMGVNNNPRLYITEEFPITGVLERVRLKRSLVLLGQILSQPSGKILLLADAGQTSRSLVAEVFKKKRQDEFLGVTVDIKVVNDWNKWKEFVRDAPQSGFNSLAILGHNTLKDQNGKPVDSDEVMKWTVDHSKLPVFGFWRFDIGPNKAFGGLVLSGKEHGEAAAALALRILNGENITDVTPIPDCCGDLIFSRDGLKRWNIVLPEGIKSKAQFVN